MNQGIWWQMANLACLGKKACVYRSPGTLGAREGAGWVLGRQHGGTCGRKDAAHPEEAGTGSQEAKKPISRPTAP